MSLPDSPNTVYAASSPIKSADLNDIQDCIVDGKHGQKYLAIPAAAARWDSGWSFAGNGNRIISSGSAVAYFPIPACVGDEIGDLVVYHYGDGAADITEIDLYKIAPLPSGTQTSMNTSGTASVTNAPASVVAKVVGVDNFVLGSGENAMVRIAVNAANIRLYGLMIGIKRP